ncbi:metallophosphoesterase family protein [Weizmannia acidilactici]|uniref:metallophosphoesterase family protein n=1 Tax=Weizmannia acidilactici TaxID=2607726 RepID=UPI0020A5378A|nr:DNA repair exonuclease [Weizmannia acidilactici]
MVLKCIRFIHAADLHLDSPFAGLRQLPQALFERVKNSTFRAFETLCDLALAKKVDFLLICGDLYDGEDRSLKAQIRLRKQFERLQEANITVFVLHGNHDHLSGTWTKLDMPANVRFFSANVETKSFTAENGAIVHLYGFSYPKRHVFEKKVDEYRKIGEADFHIGMLHGYLEGGNSLHQPYAPFALRDLLEKGMDYWALGHIHQRLILHEHPFVVYPGNIQGRNRKETGPKGCAIVEMDEFSTTVSFLETADILWEKRTVSAKGVEDFNALYAACRRTMEEARKDAQGTFLQLELQDVENLNGETLEKTKNGELMEVLQEGEESEQNFVWVHHLELPDLLSAPKMKEYEFIRQEMQKTIEVLQEEGGTVEEAVSPLFSHVYAGRYLDPFTEEEKRMLLAEAESVVLNKVRGGAKQ